MDVVGSLVRQLVRHDAECDEAAQAASPQSGHVRRVQLVVLVAAGRAATTTLEKAVCSIAFKSHLALPERRASCDVTIG
jgi:hypothetical protein